MAKRVMGAVMAALMLPATAGVAAQAGVQQSGPPQQLQQGGNVSGQQGAAAQQGGPAAAQQGGPAAAQQGGPAAAQQGAPGAPSEQGPVAAVRGQLEGVVEHVDLPDGVLRLTTGTGTVTVRGTPSQLAPLLPGAMVTLHYALVGGIPWLEGMDEAVPPGAFSGVETLTGTVQAVEEATGLVTVRQDDRVYTLRGHPDALRPLVPGQPVSLTYENVQGVPWLIEVQPTAPTQPGQQPPQGAPRQQAAPGQRAAPPQQAGPQQPAAPPQQTAPPGGAR
jgi:hypothetical protein